jgi:hypothetical protein
MEIVVKYNIFTFLLHLGSLFSSSGKHIHHGCVKIEGRMPRGILMVQSWPAAFICMLVEVTHPRHVDSNLIARNLYVKLIVILFHTH